jgi:aspartyl aminopeptidase
MPAKNLGHQTSEFTNTLLDFLQASPTPFHATLELAELLKKSGFKELPESEKWKREKGGKYFTTRNSSSIVAWTEGNQDYVNRGFRMVGAHTDSPCLKVKPHAISHSVGYSQLGVEVYGGALLATWFDRDLSLAGRVTLKSEKGQTYSKLIDFKKPIATIPNLAIHLNRSANENRTIQRQTELSPILGRLAKEWDLEKWILAELGENSKATVVGHELSLYDTQKPSLIGIDEQFISSARLDNLLSSFVAIMTLIESDSHYPSLVVCNDHEEVGSSSLAGAQGNLLKSVLERVTQGAESFYQTIANSVFISTDNAHGVHPNYSEKHDPEHLPLLNGGPVIKVNATQRYATTSDSASIFKIVCEKAAVPYQVFVSRNDVPCGSTIGPITSTELGVRTVDVGVPTFAMHSIRELAGVKDPEYLKQALKAFFLLENLGIPCV